ncbi:hypothetical protein XENOCAPTIV_029221 [Xenoophorus captivus]|uniref:Secreted protein n=1 Tax=Xenoophorus captivus TaxID=1517983 RepID=A0ABV0QV69_9TELE
MEGRPFFNKLVLYMFTVGLCAFPRHTSPIRTHPKSTFFANGSLWGPFTCLQTLSDNMSLPSRMRISVSGLSSGMSDVVCCGWDNFFRTHQFSVQTGLLAALSLWRY